jgi:hypothetical protein
MHKRVTSTNSWHALTVAKLFRPGRGGARHVLAARTCSVVNAFLQDIDCMMAKTVAGI